MVYYEQNVRFDFEQMVLEKSITDCTATAMVISSTRVRHYCGKNTNFEILNETWKTWFKKYVENYRKAIVYTHIFRVVLDAKICVSVVVEVLKNFYRNIHCVQTAITIDVRYYCS